MRDIQPGLRSESGDARYWRDASGRLTFELFHVPAVAFAPICAAVVGQFGLKPSNPLVTNGVDVIFVDYRRGEQIVAFAWDNWTRFTVFAHTPEAEGLVREIGAWLSHSEWAIQL